MPAWGDLTVGSQTMFKERWMPACRCLGRIHAMKGGDTFTRRGSGKGENGHLAGERGSHTWVNGCRRWSIRESPLSSRSSRLRVRRLLHGYGLAGTIRLGRSCLLDLLAQFLRRSLVIPPLRDASLTPRLAQASASQSLPPQRNRSGLGGATQGG